MCTISAEFCVGFEARIIRRKEDSELELQFGEIVMVS